MFQTPKVSPAPVTPQARDSQAAAQQLATKQILAAQEGGFNSYMRTGGMGVPGSSVRTSTASLLGV